MSDFTFIELDLPVTTGTVAAYCGVSEAVVLSAAKRNLIPFTKKGTREYQFQSSDLPAIKAAIEKMQAENAHKAHLPNVKMVKRVEALEAADGRRRSQIDTLIAKVNDLEGNHGTTAIYRTLRKQHDAINELNKVMGLPLLENTIDPRGL